MDHSLLATLLLGFGLGIQHSLDADHLVAVSTMVGRGGSARRSALVGVLWGAGHTVTLLAGAVVIVVLRLRVPPIASGTLEVGVGLVLCVLGVDLLVRALSGRFRVHSHAHAHAGGAHRHLHVHVPPVATHAHEHPTGMARPFVVGMVHGLAGSAALALAAMGTIASPWMALGYVVVFGGGTVVGMLALATVLGVPLASARRFSRATNFSLEVALGIGAVVVGVSHAWSALPLG